MFLINIGNLNINVHGVTYRKTVGLTLILCGLRASDDIQTCCRAARQ